MAQGSLINKHCDSKHKEFDRPDKPGYSGYLTTLVVDDKCSGKGLGSLLYEIINYHPKVKMFEKITLHLNSYASQVIAEKMGFIILETKKYTELLQDDGSSPFKDIGVKLRMKNMGPENEVFSIGVLYKNKKILPHL